MRENLSLYQNEYIFYKEIAERHEQKSGTTVDQLNLRLRQISEREKDLNTLVTQFSEENL